MNPIGATFEDYQAQYKTFLPTLMRKGLDDLQVKVHYAVTVIDRSIQVPEFALRVIQLGVASLSFIPTIKPALDMPKQVCKDAKNFTNAMKGMKSVDGFLHFQFAWKLITLNISGMTLCVVSVLSLIERTDFLDVAAIKVYLTAIPIFGILPFGGLLPLSIMGLSGINGLLAYEKRSKLLKEQARIKEKLAFWSKSLDLHDVQIREQKYLKKVSDLEEEIDAYESLIQDGMQINVDLSMKKDQTHENYICNKALNELTSTLKIKKNKLKKYEQKSTDCSVLERKWGQIASDELRDFEKANQNRCEAKLVKIQAEINSNKIAMLNNLIIFSRQALVITGVATGYGIIVLPALVNIGLDGAVAGCGTAGFFLKRSIRQMKIPSVSLAKHVHLTP